MFNDQHFKGKVLLVGAGPGDPGLITVKGKTAIEHADVLVYDHLVAQELVELTSPHARRIYVGKKAGKHVLPQEQINKLLVHEAQSGNKVVRLKGGDPFIYGRGAEECLYLKEHNIPFEIIPGVSALAAVPAYAGIPITSRGLAATFVTVTGHEVACKNKSDVDWQSIARIDGTLVIFMGVLSLRNIAEQLIHHGMSSETPAAVIRWGTTDQQQTVVETLADLPDKIESINLRPPGLIIVGEVVRLRDQLNWFETSIPKLLAASSAELESIP